MGDPAVGSEDERRGLKVGTAVVHTGVAADRARRGVRIQAVEHGVLQPESLHRFPGLLLAIGREGHDLRVERVELPLVLLEVSQLLTTVASPVAAVEEEDGDAVVELVRDTECAPVRGSRLKRREEFPDAESIHGPDSHPRSGLI
jgi:hypothetical protein